MLPLVGGVLLLELRLDYRFVYVGATVAVLSPIEEVSTHPPFTPLEVQKGHLVRLEVVGLLGIGVDVCLWGDVNLLALKSLPPETL